MKWKSIYDITVNYWKWKFLKASMLIYDYMFFLVKFEWFYT